MNYTRILVTGGAGFVGSHIALSLKAKYPDISVTALDNLRRRGSELNLPRLAKAGVNFVHGDIRSPRDLEGVGIIDLLIDCSAEPSVLAGQLSPIGVMETNLIGTVNCLEYARKHKADFIFLSSSRVYPVSLLNTLSLTEGRNRFDLAPHQTIRGVSGQGVSETFPMSGPRSFYGATKLAAELFIEEYRSAYGIKAVINRCGVIAGPWQMGKSDQGVTALWVARHLYGGELSYIGYNGTGKQVRDILHVADLTELIDIQMNDMDTYNTGVFNAGGGADNAISLRELTRLCQKATGRTIPVASVAEVRDADVAWFVTDNTKIKKVSGWKPRRSVQTTVSDIAAWIQENKKMLKPYLSK